MESSNYLPRDLPNQVFSLPKRFYSRHLPNMLTRKKPPIGSSRDSKKEDDAKEKPRCRQIVSINYQTGKIDLNTEVLKSILISEEVKNKKVAIISIAGPHRKGKSFLINFFIRYFKHKRKPNWLKVEREVPLEGFHFSRGAEADTKGIWMWSGPLITDDVAIFLMDVEGSFDSKQSDQANTNVLAWSTMISTVTIYNIMNILQKNYLDNLNYSAQYARIAVKNKNENPFQKLIFLIRDWSFVISHKFGFDGGKEYLNKCFADNEENQNSFENNENSKQTTEPETNRIQNLQTTFRELQCFLMPHPGDSVWLCENFNGEVCLLDPIFLDHLNDFVPNVISNIKVNTSLRTAEGLFMFIEDYFKAVSDAEMPKAEAHFNLQVKSHNIKAVELAKTKYNELMVEYGKGSDPVSTSKLNEDHKRSVKEALDYFQSLPKMDQNRNNQEYLKKLSDNLNKDGEDKFEVNLENKVRKISRNVGIISMGSGAAVTACAGAVYVVTTAAGVACATTGIGGIVLISVGAVCLIASKREKMWGRMKPLVPNSKAEFQQAKPDDNDSPPANSETASPTTNSETVSSPANSETASPSDNDDAGKPMVNLLNQILASSVEKKQSVFIFIFILLVVIVCLLLPLPVGMFVSALIAPLWYYVIKFV